MSVKVMSAVWDSSRSTGNARLVLLAIADSADHDGTNAWPAVATIATKTRLSRRTVQRQIKELVALGELAVVAGPSHISSQFRPNGYEIFLPGLREIDPIQSQSADCGVSPNRTSRFIPGSGWVPGPDSDILDADEPPHQGRQTDTPGRPQGRQTVHPGASRVTPNPSRPVQLPGGGVKLTPLATGFKTKE